MSHKTWFLLIALTVYIATLLLVDTVATPLKDKVQHSFHRNLEDL